MANITYPPAPRYSPQLTSLLILVPQRLWPGEASSLPHVSGVRMAELEIQTSAQICSSLFLAEPHHATSMVGRPDRMAVYKQEAKASLQRTGETTECTRGKEKHLDSASLFLLQPARSMAAPGCSGQERNIHLK